MNICRTALLAKSGMLRVRYMTLHLLYSLGGFLSLSSADTNIFELLVQMVKCMGVL